MFLQGAEQKRVSSTYGSEFDQSKALIVYNIDKKSL